MNNLNILAAHVRIQALELLRMPAFVVPTIGFPATFYALFDLSYAQREPSMAGVLMLSYITFAIVGVALFQFGVGIAADRALPWERYVRTLAAPVLVRFAARAIVAVIFAFSAAAIVILVASLGSSVHFNPVQWLTIALGAAIGGSVFTAFGIAIGYWTTPKSAVPIANIFYLLLSFAGGLWMPPQMLPHFAAVISPYTPTRQFANLLWNAPHGFSGNAALALAAFALFFIPIAAVGYRRDERERYG